MSVQKIEAQPMSKDVIASVLIQGDLSKLDTEQRLSYYTQLCDRLGLDPLTRPFEYMKLQGKETLYVRKDGTEQLRRINKVTIEKIENKVIDDVYIVTVYAKDKEGRADVASGAVSIGGLKGDAKANAIMKAETKGKRRVTLSICGVGMLDESELETIPEIKAQQQINKITKELSNDKNNQEIRPLLADQEAMRFHMDNIEKSKSIEELHNNFTAAYKYGKLIKNDQFTDAVITLKDMKKEELTSKIE